MSFFLPRRRIQSGENVICEIAHLKIVEKFGVCEKQCEEVIDVQAEIPGDDFSGIFALAPSLIGEYIGCRS